MLSIYSFDCIHIYMFIFKSLSYFSHYSKLTPYSATIPDGPTVTALESSPHVENVERDAEVTTQ